MVTLIVAVNAQNVMGKNNGIPWKRSADMKRFKAVTAGGILIMGRKTVESLPRALPGRLIFAVGQEAKVNPEAKVKANSWFPSVKEAVEAARGFEDKNHPIFIAGGRGVYLEALEENLADILDITTVPDSVTPDGEMVYFPDFNKKLYSLEKTEANPDDADLSHATYRHA